MNTARLVSAPVASPAFDFEALASRRAEFRSFLARRLPDDAIAEDVLQQCYARALASEGPRDAGRLTAWFYQSLRNAVTDFYRARAAEARKHEALRHETPEAVDEEPEANTCRCFEKLLPGLKPEYGELLRRVDLGGESPGAVAAEKGETANNVSVRLHRARKALRKQLVDCCGACAQGGCVDCTCTHG